MENKKRKIFILNHGLGKDGTATFCSNILKYIDRNKYDIHMAMAVDPDSFPQFHEDEVRNLRIPLYKISDLDGRIKKIRYVLRLYSLLKKEKPDVLHANMDLFNGINMFVAWLAGIPVRICHAHTSRSVYEARSGKHVIVSIYRATMRKLIWHFSTVRCGCSEVAMDYLYNVKWRKDPSSYIIHNGIDLHRFFQKSDSSTAKNLSLRDSVHYLITVGHLLHVKNPLFLVDVMKSVCAQRDNVELLWVGSGEMENKIRKKIADCGLAEKIHLLGARKDIPQILQCAEVFLLPSLFEGLPIVLLEAQAAGLACVVSNKVTKEVDMGGCMFLDIENGTAEWSAVITDLIDGNIAPKILPEKMQQYDVSFMLNQLEKIYAEKK